MFIFFIFVIVIHPRTLFSALRSQIRTQLLHFDQLLERRSEGAFLGGVDGEPDGEAAADGRLVELVVVSGFVFVVVIVEGVASSWDDVFFYVLLVLVLLHLWFLLEIHASKLKFTRRRSRVHLGSQRWHPLLDPVSTQLRRLLLTGGDNILFYGVCVAFNCCIILASIILSSIKVFIVPPRHSMQPSRSPSLLLEIIIRKSQCFIFKCFILHSTRVFTSGEFTHVCFLRW